MGKVVFIKQNSYEVRDKLRKAGYTLCACTKFVDAIWLDYHPEVGMYRDIHGVGYTDECEGLTELTPEERIQVWLNKKGYYSEEREFCDTVEKFLKKYPKPKREE